MLLFKLMHLFAVLIWIGGMFFAYMVLRPSAAEVLQPPGRLRLWNKIFRRFFNWVWLCILVLMASGFYLVYQPGGFAVMPRYVHLMVLLGIVMMLIFAYVFFSCYVRFGLLVEARDWNKAEGVLAAMRKLIGLNLVIGLLTVAEAIFGRG